MSQILRFQVEADARRSRLDEFLFDKLHMLSRMYLRELVRSSQVQVNGEFQNIGYRLRTNDYVEIEADLSRGTAMRPEAIPLEIVYEDEEIIVVNKAAGMLVHPTHREKNGTLLNALTHHINRSIYEGAVPGQALEANTRIIRPGLVHRLDKETSGLIVIAKSLRSHRKLAAAFMKKRIEKRYLALVDGLVKLDEGVIDAPIGRFAELKLWNVKANGKPSETRFRVRERFNDKTLLELEPVTGRTNQLRIHCAAIGHPITGDSERGGSRHKRLCLHASRLAFEQPTQRNRLIFENFSPDEFST
jgi:23S rRNA pseudouridine1911/1915/1917 synthase